MSRNFNGIRDTDHSKTVYFQFAPKYQSLVFETFLKYGKLKCKSTFNKTKVFLLMIEHIETNQIVLYLPGDI